MSNKRRGFFPIFGRAAIPGGAALAAGLGLLYRITVRKVDEQYLGQIHVLQSRLGITEGDKMILERARKSMWWRIRQIIWPLFFGVAEASYLWIFFLFLIR